MMILMTMTMVVTLMMVIVMTFDISVKKGSVVCTYFRTITGTTSPGV